MRAPVAGARHDQLLFGRWPVKEALEGGGVAKVMLARGAHGEAIDSILQLAKAHKVPFRFLDRREIDRMTNGNHQGVVALASPFSLTDLETVLDAARGAPSKGVSLLFLDGIQDPHNVGSLIRSAAFFGVGGVVVPRWRAASLTGTVMKTSAGGARYVRVCQVANLTMALRRAREKGIWLIGADMAGQPMRSVDVPRPMALVLGAEGEGLHRLTKETCDMVVSIPGAPERSGMTSLNVGVAGGILMGHFS